MLQYSGNFLYFMPHSGHFVGNQMKDGLYGVPAERIVLSRWHQTFRWNVFNHVCIFFTHETFLTERLFLLKLASYLSYRKISILN